MIVLCVGLRNKQYCTFNKQYTKEEYKKNSQNIVMAVIKTLKTRNKFEELKPKFQENMQ